MVLRKGFKAMLEEALADITTLSVLEAMERHGDEDVLFVDLRDPRELEREGAMPEAFHAPRGMLEFWIDPESPYHKPILTSGKTLIFFCAGGWRSALAAKTVKDMGLENVAHVHGGFGAWKQAGGPVASFGPPPTPASPAAPKRKRPARRKAAKPAPKRAKAAKPKPKARRRPARAASRPGKARRRR